MPKISKTFKKLIGTINTNKLSVYSVNEKEEGSADGAIIEYRIENKKNQESEVTYTNTKAMVKTGLSSMPQNTVFYEVAIADLMQKLGLNVAKKMLISGKKAPEQSFVVSKWEKNLKKIRSNKDIDSSGMIEKKIQEFIKLYKKETNPNQKELYKMCACLLASGMTDLKIGDNIMADKNGRPIAVDTGFSYFTQFPKIFTIFKRYNCWQKCIDILKNDKSEEIREWGNLIQGYKDFALKYIETKPSNPEIKSTLTNDEFNKIKEGQEKFKSSGVLESVIKLIQKAEDNLKKVYNRTNKITSSTSEQQNYQLDLGQLRQENKAEQQNYQLDLGQLEQENKELRIQREQILEHNFTNKKRNLAQKQNTEKRFKHLIY